MSDDREIAGSGNDRDRYPQRVTSHPFVPLRHRNVRLLWSAAVISDIGTWVQLIVVGSLIAATTGSAVQTGLVALATFMPQGIASPIGGLLADRYDRRKVFSIALLVQALVTTGLAVALGAGVREPMVLTTFILFASAAGATGAPSYSAMLPDLVPPNELMAMVSLGVYSWNAGRIVGPMLGSVLALTVGPAWTIAFNAATFVVLSLAVTLLRQPFLPHGDGGGTITERLVGGWRTLRTSPGPWHAVTLLVLFNLFIVPFMGLIPIYAAEFGGGTGVAGLIASAQGIGAIAGGIAVTVLATRTTRANLAAGIGIAVAFGLALYAVAPTVGFVVVVAALLGACGSGVFITGSTIVQRDAPDASRGRVMSIMQAAMGISYGIGLLFIGSIADATHLRLAFGVGAVLMAVGVVTLTRRSPYWRQAFDGDPIPADEPVDALLCPA